MKKLLAAVLASLALLVAAATPAHAAGYWRATTFGAQQGDLADVQVVYNGVTKYDVDDSYLPNHFVVFLNPAGTLTVTAQRATGPLNCELVVNGVVVHSDSDPGPNASVTCTHTG